jgi:hypothetical protein
MACVCGINRAQFLMQHLWRWRWRLNELGVYLTDLTFVEDGNPDRVQGMTNFRKRKLEYDVIVQVRRYQDMAYNFKLVCCTYITLGSHTVIVVLGCVVLNSNTTYQNHNKRS